MALVIKDRVKETTTTTGTGTYTLAGAEVGFQSFSTIGNGNTTYYAVTYNNDWEVGIGTYTSSGTTLARTTILSSSNSNNAVNWSSGEKSVFVTQPSSKASFLDASGNLNLSGDIVVSGTVDGRDVAADGTTADNALPKAGGTITGTVTVSANAIGTVTTDNDGSFAMSAGNNFKCTPSGNFTLTFTSIVAQSGNILLINSGGHTVSAHANTKVDAKLLSTVSSAGTYLLSYFSDGTNVYMTNSAVYT